jgi:hypothetical protein
LPLCPLCIFCLCVASCTSLCLSLHTQKHRLPPPCARTALARVPCCPCARSAQARVTCLCAPGISCVALFPPLLPLRCIANSRQRYFAGGCAPGISCVAKSKAKVPNSRQRYFAGRCAPGISSVAQPTAGKGPLLADAHRASVALHCCHRARSAQARLPCCLFLHTHKQRLLMRTGHKLRC